MVISVACQANCTFVTRAGRGGHQYQAPALSQQHVQQYWNTVLTSSSSSSQVRPTSFLPPILILPHLLNDLFLCGICINLEDNSEGRNFPTC